MAYREVGTLAESSDRSQQSRPRGWEPAPTLHISSTQLSSPLSMKPWMMNRVFLSVWKFDASIVDGSEGSRICDKCRRIEYFCNPAMQACLSSPSAVYQRYKLPKFSTKATSSMKPALTSLFLSRLPKSGNPVSTGSVLWLQVLPSITLFGKLFAPDQNHTTRQRFWQMWTIHSFKPTFYQRPTLSRPG